MQIIAVPSPVVTPMLADESLDLPGLWAHIDFLLGEGVHGIYNTLDGYCTDAGTLDSLDVANDLVRKQAPTY